MGIDTQVDGYMNRHTVMIPLAYLSLA